MDCEAKNERLANLRAFIFAANIYLKILGITTSTVEHLNQQLSLIHNSNKIFHLLLLNISYLFLFHYSYIF